ncbi:protein of unknown function [Shewanella benthica]|uniref:Uncharacterized protein n=1 Tax=Shewanella benthica TaxID=43661 RepID=A0A330LWK5_9GAMM|nr:protein of unknown function [Shewanella benthica]
MHSDWTAGDSGYRANDYCCYEGISYKYPLSITFIKPRT